MKQYTVAWVIELEAKNDKEVLELAREQLEKEYPNLLLEIVDEQHKYRKVIQL